MRKVMTMFIILISLFLFVSTISAAECSNQELAKLKKEAANVKLTYIETERKLDPSEYTASDVEIDTAPCFKMTLSNVTDKFTVKITNDYNNDTVNVNYGKTIKGIYEFNWNYVMRINKFKYEVFSSSNTNCAAKTLYVGYLVTPRYNPISEKSICITAGDIEQCKQYLSYDFNEDELTRQVNKYLEELNNKAAKQNIFTTIGGFIKDHWLLVGVGTLAVAGGVTATIVIKKRREDFGI